jgi:hypothetical protein
MATGAYRPYDHHIVTLRHISLIDGVTVAIVASSKKETRVSEVPFGFGVACEAKEASVGPKGKVRVRGVSSAQVLKCVEKRASSSLTLWLVEVKVVGQ